jgi:hypothetical protein
VAVLLSTPSIHAPIPAQRVLFASCCSSAHEPQISPSGLMARTRQRRQNSTRSRPGDVFRCPISFLSWLTPYAYPVFQLEDFSPEFRICSAFWKADITWNKEAELMREEEVPVKFGLPSVCRRAFLPVHVDIEHLYFVVRARLFVCGYYSA